MNIGRPVGGQLCMKMWKSLMLLHTAEEKCLILIIVRVFSVCLVLGVTQTCANNIFRTKTMLMHRRCYAERRIHVSVCIYVK